ncbi:glycosyltransferase [Kineococcus auxinigenes]|uniref:glycosyltransferase n=1 Tax=unclassified Kineococcus TaxID=2621656 RepID=UPI003D7EF1F7
MSTATAPDLASSGDVTTPTVSVVVPAHDEARTLHRTLAALRTAAVREVPDVVVVANGCSDDTAEVARAAGVRVVELGQASKAAALRAGDEAALTFPRVYLDADIVLTPGALDELTDTLRTDEPVVASPRVKFDTAASSWPVRAFYRAYEQIPYVREGLVGLGVYGVSRTGRARFGQFPDVRGDDLFVQRLFAPAERRTSGGRFVVAAPRDLRNLVRVRTRTALGNAELAGAAPVPSSAGASAGFERSTDSTVAALVRTAVSRPAMVPAVAVYVGVTVVSRLLACSRRGTAWHRDSSTR